MKTRQTMLAAAVLATALTGLAESPDWTQYDKTLDLTLKGAEDGSTLTNFPLAVRLAAHAIPGFDPTDSKASGRDIRFSLADGTELASELDTWNAAGESVVWVRVPELTPKMTLRMHVGKAGDAGYATPSEVWAGYAGVWHLNETGNAQATLAEATANGITGTGGPNSIATADGAFGGSRGTRTSGVKYPIFSTANNAALDVGARFTVSAWLRSAGASDWAYIASRKDADTTTAWGVQFAGSNARYSARFYFEGEQNKCTGTGSTFFLTTNDWIKVDAVYNLSNVSFYANGKLLGSTTQSTYAAPQQGSLGLRVGGLGNAHGTFNGDMDEIRYVAGVRSAAWIGAEYESQRPGSAFITWATPDGWRDDTSDLKETLAFTVEGVPPLAALTNFPALVRLREGLGGGFNYADCRADGKDLSFALADGTFLPHEIDTWNTNGFSYVWVRLPVATNGLTFALHYGGEPRGYAAAATWAGYAGVWHLNETKTGNGETTVAEASPNDILTTGDWNSLITRDGVFGAARGTRKTHVNGAICKTHYDTALDVGTVFTFSAWIRSAGEVYWGYLVSRKMYDKTLAWGVQQRGDNSRTAPGFWDTGIDRASSAQPTIGGVKQFYLTTNEWIKIDAIFNEKNVAFYANGTSLGTATMVDVAQQGTLGLYLGGIGNADGTFNGDMDEARYIGVARSAAWVQAEYRTMTEPETFLRADYATTNALDKTQFVKFVPLSFAGYAGSETLTNFPVLVRISDALIPGFSYAEANGLNGVRFTDANLVTLPFECETWNESGESIFWVSVPRLDATTTLRFYYGKKEDAKAGGTEHAEDVWRRANYAEVMHLDVSTNYTVRGVMTRNLGTLQNPTNTMVGAAGLIGGGYENPAWSGKTLRGIELAAGTTGYGAIRPALTNATALTFSAWVWNKGGTGDGTDANYGHLFHQERYNPDKNGYGRFEVCVEGSPTYFTIRDKGGEFTKKSCADLSGGWHLVTLTYAGAKRRMYIDGAEVTSLASDTTGYWPKPTQAFYIGDNTGEPGGRWVGGIDEVRFRAAGTSTDWMNAEVANLTDEGLFAYGKPELSDPPKFFYIIVK